MFCLCVWCFFSNVLKKLRKISELWGYIKLDGTLGYLKMYQVSFSSTIFQSLSMNSWRAGDVLKIHVGRSSISWMSSSGTLAMCLCS